MGVGPTDGVGVGGRGGVVRVDPAFSEFSSGTVPPHI